jgi:hypothetical protein
LQQPHGCVSSCRGCGAQSQWQRTHPCTSLHRPQSLHTGHAALCTP